MPICLLLSIIFDNLHKAFVDYIVRCSQSMEEGIAKFLSVQKLILKEIFLITQRLIRMVSANIIKLKHLNNTFTSLSELIIHILNKYL